jgi:hypothetical protein
MGRETLTHGGYKAEGFSLNIPREFRVAYQKSSGETVVGDILADISSYKQREHEIEDRVRQLAEGVAPHKTRTSATTANIRTLCGPRLDRSAGRRSPLLVRS